MKTKQTGFTLVEIAIVLVIIGLLLGGILKGQEMIVQAKIKNAITDFSGISAAYYGYQDRYRAIPGDDANASRWTTPTGVVAGNGDSILTGLYNGTTAESMQFWDHLRRSGFVTGALGPTAPVNSFAGPMGVQQGDGIGTSGPPVVAVGAVMATANVPGFTNLIMCSTNLPDKVAIALDVQMDDGSPFTGAVRANLVAGAAAIPATILTIATSSYIETGTTTYTLCRQF